MHVFDPLASLRVLAEHGVRCIVIGDVAAYAWGWPAVTADLDICYDDRAENVIALAAALKRLEAIPRGADSVTSLDEETLEVGASLTLDTKAGDLNCLAAPPGTRGYDDLLARATELTIEGVEIRFASLDDLIVMKRAAGRSKDEAQAAMLAALRDEIRRQS